MKKFLCIALSGLIVLGSCTESKVVDPAELMAYVNEVENGLYQERSFGPFHLALKYLPKHYMASNEIETGSTSAEVDSVLATYEKSLTFQFELNSADGSFDVLKGTSMGMNDYRQKVGELHFRLKEHFKLRLGDVELQPDLVHFEDNFGMQTGKKFLVVFNEEPANLLEQEDELTVVFEDPMFQTGLSAFKFRTSDIKKAPLIFKTGKP